MPKYYQFFFLEKNTQRLLSWGNTVATSYQRALSHMRHFGVLPENYENIQIVYTVSSLWHQLAVLLIPNYKKAIKPRGGK